jgi:para-aminobenzoate synthetase
MRTLLIDNYDSFTFNLYQLIGEVNGSPPIVIRNDTASWSEIKDLDFDNIVISPGPGRPEKRRDFGVCSEIIKNCDAPLLGVCLGHQGLCHSFDGRVNYAPECMHGRVSKIYHSGVDIFRNIPSPFEAVRYHSLIVDQLPDEFEVISWTEDSLIMGVRHRYRNLWGVQFHPESICTEFGHVLIQNFNNLTKSYLKEHPPSRRITDKGPRKKSAQEFDVVSKLGSISKPLKGEINGPTINGKNVHLKTRRIKLEELDSKSIFLDLYSKSSTAFWLDTSLETPFSRFSFMGDSSGPFSEYVTYDVAKKVVSVSKNEELAEYKETLFDYLNRQLKERFIKDDSLPFDFNLGYVGYLGYELKADCFGGLAHKSELPDAALIFADRLIAIDHFENVLYLVALAETDDDSYCLSWMDQIESRVSNISTQNIIKPNAKRSISNSQNMNEDIHIEMRHAESKYLELIEICKQRIREGESYEICLTNEITYHEQTDPLETYQYLRMINPSPYSSFLRFPEVSVLCSSPERFLKIDSNGIVESKPIKGTRSRSQSKERDEELYQDLSLSEKDRAENLMIVDLLRNDLGTVCDLRSVFVSKIFSVESYATVHQLVSTINGRLRKDVSAIDCIKTTFPGGSMTGTPKKRTMEIIDELEAGPRGVYSGSIGYLSLNGSADLNIVIRTLVCTNDKITQGAGGAVVALSDSQDEFQEMLLKAKAQQQAVITSGV